MLTNISTQCHLWHDYGFSRKAALHAIVELRMSTANSRGKGNKAAKRAARAETNAWFDHHCRMTDKDIAAMYDEFRTEGKVRQ
jgi:hypothetical protein